MTINKDSRKALMTPRTFWMYLITGSAAWLIVMGIYWLTPITHVVWKSS